MKKFIFILIIVFILIGFNEVKNFNDTVNSMKAINQISHACSIDMQKDNNLLCD